MPKAPRGNPTLVEYWDERVRTAPDLKSMIFIDRRFDEYEARVRAILSGWKGSALDIACGYGRYSAFDDYLGVDFSGEMLKLAIEKHPDKLFQQANIKSWKPDRKFDYIFEVNSLRSLGMSQDDFLNLFTPFANKAVACLEADQFFIKQIYDRQG